MALVIKQWSASDKPDSSGELIRIHGREAGLINFFLSLVGVDPTTTLIVDQNSVRYEAGSWAGFERSVTPLKQVSTAIYGYFKPWKPALFMAVIGFALLSIPVIGWVLGLLAILIAPFYYFLNKQLFIRILCAGVVVAKIEFKRSIIEGRSIDEQAGEQIANIIEMLLLGLERPRALSGPRPAPTSPRAALEQAGAELGNVAERARERAEALRAQASRFADQIAAKSASPVAPASAGSTIMGSGPALKCAACGTTLKPGDAFCQNCGQKAV